MVVAAASAHRPADGELAVRGRDRAPRQRRQPRARAPGRAQPHDRRARHLALRGLDARHDHACTACSSGSRCPTHRAHVAPFFEHHDPRRVALGDATVRVFVGELAGARRTPHRHRSRSSPRCSAPSSTCPRAARRPPARPRLRARRPRRRRPRDLEVDARTPSTRLGCASSATSRPAATRLQLDGRRRPRRVVLLGGEPFDEEIVMWWNFIGRSHDEIVEFRRPGSPT